MLGMNELPFLKREVKAEAATETGKTVQVKRGKAEWLPVIRRLTERDRRIFHGAVFTDGI